MNLGDPSSYKNEYQCNNCKKRVVRTQRRSAYACPGCGKTRTMEYIRRVSPAIFKGK